jgi:hypothetical protein
MGHFDGHAITLEQYRQHCPMQHIQGYPAGSHWTLPLGDYLLRITPAAARATANKTTRKTSTYFAGPFDGHGNVLLHYNVHHLMVKVQGFTRSH